MGLQSKIQNLKSKIVWTPLLPVEGWPKAGVEGGGRFFNPKSKIQNQDAGMFMVNASFHADPSFT